MSAERHHRTHAIQAKQHCASSRNQRLVYGVSPAMRFVLLWGHSFGTH